ncbi:hypothetical protein TWF481_005522 [Arthrobotrys musiformis]|uniref:Uncharacterized protein n=1 Tax=Arthrobotrys musiformis TaxID=47236 RepID=A0AAV9WE16_9PEZI
MSKRPAPQPPSATSQNSDATSRPRVKKTMIWHHGHCTRGFMVTDFHGDIGNIALRHGNIIKCCGLYWKANIIWVDTTQIDGVQSDVDFEEPYPIYKRYRSSTIDDIHVSIVARPLDRCTCSVNTPYTVPKPLTTVSPHPRPSRRESGGTVTSRYDTPSPTIQHKSPVIPNFPATINTTTPTATVKPEPQGYSTPPTRSSRGSRDSPVSGRLPLDRERTPTSRLSDGIESALGKLSLKRGKEKERGKESRSQSPEFWCIGDGDMSVQEGGRSPVYDQGKVEGCQHVYYCSFCGERNSVWSDRREA